MTSPDGLELIATSALFVSAALLIRYRQRVGERRARVDQAEDARLTAWVEDLRAAGADQATDPNLGAVIQRYAAMHGTGRHRASDLRPATMEIRA